MKIESSFPLRNDKDISYECFFYDKELSDIIRDISINSPLSSIEVFCLLRVSNDIMKDSEIIKKLSCNGFKFENIKSIIYALNN
jgi:hypothetical protein